MDHKAHCPQGLKLTDATDKYTCTCQEQAKFWQYTD